MDTCCICLDELCLAQSITNCVNLNCNHKYHKECLLEYVRKKGIINELQCPMCRATITKVNDNELQKVIMMYYMNPEKLKLVKVDNKMCRIIIDFSPVHMFQFIKIIYRKWLIKHTYEGIKLLNAWGRINNTFSNRFTNFKSTFRTHF